MSRVGAERKKHTVMQVEVALEVGKTQAWVSLVEAGKIKLSRKREREVIGAIRRVGERRAKIHAVVVNLVTSGEMDNEPRTQAADRR